MEQWHTGDPLIQDTPAQSSPVTVSKTLETDASPYMKLREANIAQKNARFILLGLLATIPTSNEATPAKQPANSVKMGQTNSCTKVFLGIF